MFRTSLLLAILTVAVLRANAGPEDLFLQLVAQVESGDDANAIGDRGKSHGIMQMQRQSWEDVNNYRKSVGLRTYDFKSFRLSERVNSEFGRQFIMVVQKARLRTALGRSPTFLELYAAHNLGFSGFKKRGFNLKNLPPQTRRNCSRIERGLQGEGYNLAVN